MANQVWLLRQQKLSAEMPDQPIPSNIVSPIETQGNQVDLMDTSSISYVPHLTNMSNTGSIQFQNVPTITPPHIPPHIPPLQR